MNATTAIAVAGARLSQPFTSEDHRLARETILAGMTATKTVRGRNAAEKIVYVREPDWATRLPAAVKVCEFVGGRPIAMTLSADISGKNGIQSEAEYLAAIQKDPAALRLLADIFNGYAAAAETKRPIDVATSPAPAETQGETARL